MAAMPPAISSPGRRGGSRGAGTPPGWSKGQKTGWQGGSKPPGLSKH